MIVAKNRNPVSLREDAFALYNGVMQYLYARYRINHIALCVCGAITFEREQDVSWSVSLENAPCFFPELPGAFFEILHGKSVILGDCCAVGINPFSAVNGCRDGVVVGVVMDVYALNTNRRIAERYFYLWRVVGSARPLTDGEVVFATSHFLGIYFPLVVVPTNGVYLRASMQEFCKVGRLSSAAMCAGEQT